MSTTSSTVITSPVKFIVHTFTQNTDTKLLKIEQDNSVTVNGKPKDYQDSSVQFFIDRTSVNNGSSTGPLVFRFRPVSKPDDFLAVSGQSVVLKPRSQVNSDNSHNFLVKQANSDFTKYQVLSSPANAPTFITPDQNGSVLIAPDSPSDLRRAWFKAVPVSDFNINDTVNKVVTSSVEIDMEFKEIIVVEE